ncbi:FtsX-like permease family protein [Neobacillus sp. Marseille-QA0830]
MTLYKLAGKNIRLNIRKYLLYLYSMVFSVAIYFTFVSLQYNQQLVNQTVTLGKVESAFFAASIVLVIFSGIFVWYSNSFFTRTRKKEVGLYALFGMNRKKIGWLLFYENMIIGLLALVMGVGAGLLFSKLFVMMIFKLMGFRIDIVLTISRTAFIQTILVFLVIITITSIHSYRLIYRFSLSELFKGERKGERISKGNPIVGIMGLVFLGFAYLLIMNPEGITMIHNTGTRLITATIVLIIGSYFFMSSFSVYLLNRLKRVMPVYFKARNLLSISQIVYRIKGNVLVLTVISLLTSMTLLVCSFVFGLYYQVDSITNRDLPYSYVFNLKNDQANQQLRDLIEKDSRNHLDYRAEIEYIPVKSDPANSQLVPEVFQMMLIPETEFYKLLKQRGQSETISIGNDEALSFFDGSLDVKADKYTGKQLTVANGKKLTIAEYKSYSLLNQGELLAPFVISDGLYDQLKKEQAAEKLYLYKISNQKSLNSLDLNLRKIVEPLMAGQEEPIYSSFYENYHRALETYGLMIFIGGFLGLVFLIATGSMIYFKQLMEASADKGRYRILRKIGVPDTEIKKTVQRQVGFVFALPLLLAVATSGINTFVIADFLQFPLQVPYILVLTAYLVIYSIYFQMTSYGYLRHIKTIS